jgi:glycosyltransferase involved in cell wall biosynthesis
MSVQTTSAAPSISVCIPAYNRAEHLAPLLDSILAQDYAAHEIVICEDGSRERAQIRAVAERYAVEHPGRVRYFENAENLGYDANFRELLARATGDYCFIMGNDDLVCPGALRTVADALARHPDVGVVLRTFATFEGTPDRVVRVSRYFPHETLFPAGPDTVVAFFRRLVAMSGIVLRRADAVAVATDRFDGTLFYQQHVASHILMHRPGLFVPQVLVLFRKGGVPEFGMSARERGKFTPGKQPPETDLHMLRGLLDIAAHVDETYRVRVRRRVLWDFGNYIYPTLAHQAHEPFRVFVRFYLALARMGFWRNPLFHAQALLVATLGTRRLDRAIAWVRRALGYTPQIGRRPAGARVVGAVASRAHAGDQPGGSG